MVTEEVAIESVLAVDEVTNGSETATVVRSISIGTEVVVRGEVEGLGKEVGLIVGEGEVHGGKAGLIVELDKVKGSVRAEEGRFNELLDEEHEGKGSLQGEAESDLEA